MHIFLRFSRMFLLHCLPRGGRPTITISRPSHILIIFSSEPPQNPRPSNIILERTIMTRWLGRENYENVTRTIYCCCWPSSPRPPTTQNDDKTVGFKQIQINLIQDLPINLRIGWQDPVCLVLPTFTEFFLWCLCLLGHPVQNSYSTNQKCLLLCLSCPLFYAINIRHSSFLFCFLIIYRFFSSFTPFSS